jgi:hypothetical protein
MRRRDLLLAAAAPSGKGPEIVNAHYFRAHMYTYYPRNIEDPERNMRAVENALRALRKG